ncbi:MAG TPA: hypothetical protein VF438_02235 [Candidatus Paceibacterota bacterium]
MTVCIAAVADNGKKLIVTTDNMITVSIGGTTQYQREDTNYKKLYKLNNKTYALIAGSTAPTDTIVRLAMKKIGPNMTPRNAAEHVKEAFQDFYRGQIEDSFLKKFGIGMHSFMNDQKKLDPIVVKDLLDKINGYATDTFITVAGYDETAGGAYIGTVGGFTLVDRTVEGFFASGGGADLAKYSLIISGYSYDKPVAEVEVMVRKAMNDARKSPGVGDMGDLVTLPV